MKASLKETLEIPKVEPPSIRKFEKLKIKQEQKEIEKNGKKYLETSSPDPTSHLAAVEETKQDKVDQSHSKSKSDKSVVAAAKQIEMDSTSQPSLQVAARARQVKFDWLQNNTKCPGLL